ncbi:MAG: fimbrillin family protein, partial [Rikenellaceae bacterium]
MNKFSYKISLLVALLLVSCSEDPDVVYNSAVSPNSEISLSADVSLTRGVELTSGDFTSFCLYTYYSGGSEFFKETVTRDPSDGSCTFTATDPYTWPEDTALTPLSFYGYYPYDSLVPAKDDDGDVYIEYTSAADYTKQEDLVVTSKSSDAASSVHLEFAHALSKLNFTLTLDKDEVNIKNIKLYYSYKQLVTTANYYFKAEAWSDLGSKSYSSEYQFSEYDNDTSNPTHTFEHSLFMIPQVVDESGYISVRVEYEIWNGDNLNHTVQTGNLALFSSESLGSVLVDEWEMGTEYTYNLSINTDNEISFTLSVDEREEVTAQGNIDLQYISSYYDVTERIATLWADGVNDLVIAGEYSSGRLGYGSISCPFITGFGDEYVVTYTEAEDGATHVYDSETGKYSYASDGETATHVIESGSYEYNSDDNTTLFSVDFRLMTELPTFTEMHGGEPENTGDSTTDINGDDPSFPKYIFQYAERLGEVILPEDVIAIGDYAFQGCVNLDKINMFGAKHVEKCAFQGCTNLTEVITNGTEGTLTRIHDNGFDGCVSLATIDLGNIREIDQYGFV